jgi:cytochrome P450
MQPRPAGLLGCVSSPVISRLQVTSAPLTNVLTQEERLWVADPKAIHNIFQGPNRLYYDKPSFVRERSAMVIDWGVASAAGDLPLISHVLYLLTPTSGDAHKRQRRAMTPAFGHAEAKAL